MQDSDFIRLNEPGAQIPHTDAPIAAKVPGEQLSVDLVVGETTKRGEEWRGVKERKEIREGNGLVS